MQKEKAFEGYHVYVIFKLLFTEIIVLSNETGRSNTERPFVRFAWWLDPTEPAFAASSLPPILTSGVPGGQKWGAVFSETTFTRRSSAVLCREQPEPHLRHRVG